MGDVQPTTRRNFLGRAALTASLITFTQEHATAAREPWETRVDAAVERMLKEDDAPAAAIGVVRDGIIIYTKGYGRRKLPDGAAPDAETVFFIGSLSKAVTAVGMMLLVEHGKVELDAPAAKYLSDLPHAWGAVTIRQFMAHTSGIPQVSHKEKSEHDTIAGVYRALAGSQLTFAPGSKEEYNNFNFDLIGNVMETVSGLPYVKFMTRRVFKPLGMDHTGVGPISPTNRASGYNRNAEGKLKETEAEVLKLGTPSGGLESTVTDLLKLDEGLRSHRLLKPHAFEEMITPVGKFNATPGWFVRTAGKYTIVNKDGATGGYSSLFSFVAGYGHAVVILRNIQGKGVSLVPVTNEIFHAACGLPTKTKAER